MLSSLKQNDRKEVTLIVGLHNACDSCLGQLVQLERANTNEVKVKGV